MCKTGQRKVDNHVVVGFDELGNAALSRCGVMFLDVGSF